MCSVAIISWSLHDSEIPYILFHKKRCPICNQKMVKAHKKNLIHDEIQFITSTFPVKYKQTDFMWRCEKCKKAFGIATLAKYAYKLKGQKYKEKVHRFKRRNKG